MLFRTKIRTYFVFYTKQQTILSFWPATQLIQIQSGRSQLPATGNFQIRNKDKKSFELDQREARLLRLEESLKHFEVDQNRNLKELTNQNSEE